MNHDRLTNLQAVTVINLWLSTFSYKDTELITFHCSALSLFCGRFLNLCKLSRLSYFREPTGTPTFYIASMPPYLTVLQILFAPHFFVPTVDIIIIFAQTFLKCLFLMHSMCRVVYLLT